MDGSSLYIMMDEFCKLYQDKDVKPLDVEYIDYAVSENEFINSEKITNVENYWLSKINTKELPILNLPYDYAVSNVKSFNGSSVDFCVDSSIFKKVNIEFHHIHFLLVYFMLFFINILVKVI